MSKEVYVDPKRGFLYGFPKKLPEPPPEDIKKWVIEQGYPVYETEAVDFYLRFFYQEEDDVTDN